MLKSPGAKVRYQMENVDRIGYVMVAIPIREQVEQAAVGFVNNVHIELGQV